MDVLFYSLGIYWILDHYNLNDKWWVYVALLVAYILIQSFEYICKEIGKDEPVQKKKEVINYKGPFNKDLEEDAKKVFEKYKK